MTAKHALFGEWSREKFKATILDDIWPGVLFFTLVATMVTLVSEMTEIQLSFSSAMLTVLGTVLGLVISFRTSSAYERYMEGRKLWTTISLASRNIAQVIWVHVPFERVDKETGQPKSILEIAIEKKSMVNLVHAFSVSVKHLLRGEPGVGYEDLYPLVCFLPRFVTHAPEMDSAEGMLPLWRTSTMDPSKCYTINTPTSPRSLSSDGHGNTSDSHHDPESHKSQLTEEKMYPLPPSTWPPLPVGCGVYPTIHEREAALHTVPSEHPLTHARSPPTKSLFDYLPYLRNIRLIKRRFHRSTPRPDLLPTAVAASSTRTMTGKKIRREVVNSNVPLEITLFLSSYLAWLLKNKQLEPALATAFTNGISQLQDTVTNLDRIRDTPLPFAYQVHLRISLWIYLFFLPSQLWSSFHYLTIPATAFASFFLLGFLEIGQEIENPFDYDPNDLDMDSFCLSIQRELHEITAHTCPSPDEYLITSWNRPFAPGDKRTADEMMKDVNHSYHGPDTGMHSIRQTLLKSWWDVERITRN